MDGRSGVSAWVRGALAGASYEARTLVATHPSVALPLERRRRPGHVVDEATEVVIESYPRCASSFAVAAFRLAQEPTPVRIAHHTHMAAQVLEGVRRGLPTLVLIREPEPAVVSHMIFRPGLPPASAVRGFVRFYEPIEAVLPGIVVGTFEQVVNDFGSVIERMNRRFGTALRPFEHTPENLERIEGEIDADYRRRVPVEELERQVSRPSDDRRAEAERVRDRLAEVTSSAAWRWAETLYRRFAAAAQE